MISIKDILITEKVRKMLGSKGIKLDVVTYEYLNNILKSKNLRLKTLSLKDWNKFKKEEKYKKFLSNINELYDLGYGSKFISLCLSIKYKTYFSQHAIQKVIIKSKRNRIDYSTNNNIFLKSDIIVKGRLIYSKKADSTYLSFKCVNIRDLSRNKRIGVKVFYNRNHSNVFLKRDDRSTKKITVHNNELFISLYPVPKEVSNFLKGAKGTYKSTPTEVHFNSNDFGSTRDEFIDDNHARILYPKLKKFGFILPKERTTNMDRSKGDLIVFKNNKKLVIEITNLGKDISSKYNYRNRSTIRDLLIGKIIRITILNNCQKVFIFNKQIKEFVINEDFKEIINKFKIDIIFTDFKKGWATNIAEEVNILFKIK